MTSWSRPPTWRGALLTLEPLTSELVELDTEAYRSSPEAIRAHSAGRWPSAETFTAEDDAPLVAEHEAEHEAGEAFAYALLSPDRTRELGCAYLRRSSTVLEGTDSTFVDLPGEAVLLTFWLVDDQAARPSCADVLAVLRDWVRAWAPVPCVLRCLPDEHETVSAARELSLGELTVSGGGLPYRWYRVC